MDTAIITPIFNEDKKIIIRCLESVARQTHSCDHYIYLDGDQGIDKNIFSSYPKLKIFSGNLSFNDSGDTPRSILGTIILRHNYKHVHMLDVDNYFLDKSIEFINNYAEEKQLEIIFSNRVIVENGNYVNVNNTNLNYVDMNCISFHNLGIRYLKFLNYIPKELNQIDDRILFQIIKNNNINYDYLKKNTVIYENKWGNTKKKLLKKDINQNIDNFLNSRKNLSEILKIETGLKFKNE